MDTHNKHFFNGELETICNYHQILLLNTVLCWMSGHVDLKQSPKNAVSDLGLHCLLKPLSRHSLRTVT